MVSPSGVITTAADLSGDLAAGPAPSAIAAFITGLAVDPSGNLFVEESSVSFAGIRWVSTDGTIAFDGAGNLYVADGGNRVVRILRPVNP